MLPDVAELQRLVALGNVQSNTLLNCEPSATQDKWRYWPGNAFSQGWWQDNKRDFKVRLYSRGSASEWYDRKPPTLALLSHRACTTNFP